MRDGVLQLSVYAMKGFLNMNSGFNYEEEHHEK